MQIETSSETKATVILERHELRVLNNALNEVCNGVHELGDDREFATRLGSSRDEAKALLGEVSRVLQEM